MGCKFSFKRVFLVASLCLAGLFGITASVFNNANIIVSHKAVAAVGDDPGDVPWKKSKKTESGTELFIFTYILHLNVTIHSEQEINIGDTIMFHHQ